MCRRQQFSVRSCVVYRFEGRRIRFAALRLQSVARVCVYRSLLVSFSLLFVELLANSESIRLSNELNWFCDPHHHYQSSLLSISVSFVRINALNLSGMVGMCICACLCLWCTFIAFSKRIFVFTFCFSSFVLVFFFVGFGFLSQ